MPAHETLEAITSSGIIAIVREHSADLAKLEVERLIMGSGLRSNGLGTALREAVLAVASRTRTQTR